MGPCWPLGHGWPGPRGRARCGGAAWRARKPASPIMPWARRAWWRILRPPGTSPRGWSRPASRWGRPPGSRAVSSTAPSMPWPWPVPVPRRAGACAAGSTTTSLLASPAVTPRWWRRVRMAPASRVGQGQCRATRPPDPVCSSSPRRGRPWGPGAPHRAGTWGRGARGPTGSARAVSDRQTAASA